MLQHRHLTVKAEFDFSGGHFHPWVELQQSNGSQGTHSYLPTPHSLSFTAVKCLSIFLIYKTARDFEKFSTQAPVLEWHKGAEEEEEDAESSTPVPKILAWCPSDMQGVHPCPSHMETCTGEVSFPSWAGKWLHHLPSDDGEGKQLCINKPWGLWQHQRGASVAFCSGAHTTCSSQE